MRRAEPTLAPATYVTQLAVHAAVSGVWKRRRRWVRRWYFNARTHKKVHFTNFNRSSMIHHGNAAVLAASFAHQIAPLCDSSSSAPRECGTRHDRGFVLSRLCLLT